MFLVAGTPTDARLFGADGWHTNASRKVRGKVRPVSTGVHNGRELAAAIDAQIPVVFISPIFATKSHPGGAISGRRGFARLARRFAKNGTGVAIALGGMNALSFRLLRHDGAHGWAAIDALSVGNQKG